MRILFVTPYVPSRIRVRPFNLIKALAKEHEISLVSLLVDGYERTLVKDIEPYCVSIDLVPLRKWQAYANCLRALPSAVPLRVAYYRSNAFVQRIREVIQRRRIEVIHGELIKVVPALKAVQQEEHIPVVYDSVDCISWFLQQAMETAHTPLKKLFLYSELQKMRGYEQRELLAFDQLVIASPSDRERLEQLIGRATSIQVVSNCVDTDYFAPADVVRRPNSLIFCAKLDYFPNAQAILHFCKQILPLVWQQLPDVRLTIVGNNPPPAVQALQSDQRIKVTGYVPDTRTYLGTATVALAPLLVAAGTQFKILEALAMETPMVTTPRCSQALGTRDGLHLLEAETPQEYAQAVVKVLTQPRLSRRLGYMGRRFVMEHYSWAGAAHTLNELYRAALAKQRKLAAEPALSSSLKRNKGGQTHED